MGATKRRTRGDGALYRKVREGRADLWVARVDLGKGGDGKRRSREVSSTDYATAVKRLRELRREVEDGTGERTVPSMTLQRWLDHWLAEVVAVEKDPKTLAGYRSACKTWLIPHLGQYRLDRIEAQHVRDLYKTMRAKPLAESSVLKVHNVLAKALKDAMDETGLRRNVTAHIKRPTPAKRNETLTTAQAKKLLATVQTDPNGGRRAASLYLGIRQGEVLGMAWDRIDMTTGTLDLAWQLQRLTFRHGCDGTCGKKRAGSCPSRELEVPPGFDYRQLDGGLTLTKPKGGRDRIMPIPPPLLGWLVGRKAQQTGPNPHGLVWTRPDGRPIDPRDDLQGWHDALDDAGLPSVMLHAARHTTATLLREYGVPVDVIQSILGHSSAVTTQGYLHEDLTLARDALARLQIED